MSVPRDDTPTGYARRLLRESLAKRDGACCFYCRAPFRKLNHKATLDHYVPYRLWRGWAEDNLVLACRPCNEAKADALPWPLVWLLLAGRDRYAQAA
jgi:5-methylcytosine-specific restriction endonuclease McrA